jgi:hypothetical protein
MGEEYKTPPPEEQEGYERTDVNLNKIIGITLGSLALLVVILIVLTQYFTSYKEQRIYEVVLKPESAALRDLRAQEDKLLNSYEVIDKEKGQYRIPIRRAMELTAEEAYKERQEK